MPPHRESPAPRGAQPRGSLPQAQLPGPAGRYAYPGLERVIHEKARLGILTALAAHAEGLLFSQLKQFCRLTDGNLSRHLQALTEADLIDVWRGVRGRRRQTLYRLTGSGRERFRQYIAVLEQVVADASRAPAGATAAPPRPRG